jgi:hypothetical protein
VIYCCLYPSRLLCCCLCPIMFVPCFVLLPCCTAATERVLEWREAVRFCPLIK